MVPFGVNNISYLVLTVWYNIAQMLQQMIQHNQVRDFRSRDHQYSSTLFPSQYYVYLQLDFKVKNIYGTQISKYVTSTEKCSVFIQFE